MNPVDPEALRMVLDGRWEPVRQEVRARLKDLALPSDGDDLAEQRAKVMEDLKKLAESGHARLGFPKEYGGAGDVGGSVVSFETLGFGDLSLLVKSGVQWGLFGG